MIGRLLSCMSGLKTMAANPNPLKIASGQFILGTWNAFESLCFLLFLLSPPPPRYKLYTLSNQIGYHCFFLFGFDLFVFWLDVSFFYYYFSVLCKLLCLK